MLEKTPLRVGVIGAGPHATENLYPALLLDPDLDLGVVCTRSRHTAEYAAQRWRAAGWTTAMSDVFDDSDAVVVSGPPELHEEAIAQATARRVPLFVEKPPARSAAHLTSATTGSLDTAAVFVDFNLRLASAYTAAIDPVAPTEPQLMSVRMISRKPLSVMWHCDTVLESYLLAMGIHGIDMVTSRFGEPRSVTSHLTRLDGTRFALVVSLGFTGDRAALLEFGNYSNTFESSVVVSTAHGSVGVDNLTTRWVRDGSLGDRSATVTQVGGLAGGFVRSGYGTALARFATMARHGEPSTSGLAAAKTALDLIDAILRQTERR